MTRNMSPNLQGKNIRPRQADRRKATVLRRVPLIGGLGLVLNDRRSYRERRRNAGNQNLVPPCALLRRLEQTPDDKKLFGIVGLHWHRAKDNGQACRRQEVPWLLRWRQPPNEAERRSLGFWIKRYLHYPWRG